MTSLKPAFRSANVRRALGWLVACVVALQGLGVSIAMGRGPAHVHVATGANAMVLVDVRRGAFAVDAPVASGFSQLVGHQHGVARHFHPANDGSVLVSAADRRIDAASDGAHVLDLVVAAFMAVVGTALLWLVTVTARHGMARHTGWQPSFGFAKRLDRPPQFR